MSKTVLAVTSGVATALGASLCCVGPVLAAVAGIGGAGLASRFEPLRPYLLAATVLLFVVAGFALHRPESDATCRRSGACGPAKRRRERAVFWLAAGVAVIVAAFPEWSMLLV